MRTVEDIARILGTAIDESQHQGWQDLPEYQYFGLDGYYNLHEVVKKLQALGIIESSETE